MQPVEVQFLGAFPSPEHLPEESIYPEIAFSGRSNVGKSSLLNTLVQRRKLAYVSSKPGKTRQFGFYLVNQSVIFVDLPGFGYARVAKEHRWLWSKRIEQYLLYRPQLCCVCYLIDSRHDPFDIDLGVLEWLENHARRYIVVLTKVDKLSQKQLQDRQSQIAFLLQQCQYLQGIIPFSARTKVGVKELWKIIWQQVKGMKV